MDKLLIWISGRDLVHTPPMSTAARGEIGDLLRQVQQGVNLSMPHSRPMPSIARGVHELRVIDEDKNWRLIYSIDDECIAVLEVFEKKTQATPDAIIKVCARRVADLRVMLRASRQ